MDSIALAGIAMKAYPGCEILAAKNGVVFYHKAFGYHTYADTLPEKMSDLYDMASLTKILATTLSLMKLNEQGIINLNQKLSYYLPVLRHSNKKDLGMKEILAHHMGLKRIVFTPRKFLPLKKINPTQDDTVFRKQQIWGDAQDQGEPCWAAFPEMQDCSAMPMMWPPSCRCS